MSTPASATTTRTCAFCPGASTPADGTVIDRNSETRDVCAECIVLIWARDWPAMELKILDYQMSDTTRLERLLRGWRARRTARRWTAAVRGLTEASRSSSTIHTNRRTP